MSGSDEGQADVLKTQASSPKLQAVLELGIQLMVGFQFNGFI